MKMKIHFDRSLYTFNNIFSVNAHSMCSTSIRLANDTSVIASLFRLDYTMLLTVSKL